MHTDSALYIILFPVRLPPDALVYLGMRVLQSVSGGGGAAALSSFWLEPARNLYIILSILLQGLRALLAMDSVLWVRQKRSDPVCGKNAQEQKTLGDKGQNTEYIY